jgi:hypothetical protein
MDLIERPATPETPSSASRDNTEIAKLVAAVYETIPPQEKSRMLGLLLRPLGILSMVAVADGIFARLWIRSGQQLTAFRLDDMQGIRASDVADLVTFVQQVSVETVDGLSAMLTSPALVGSATVAILLGALMQRAQLRRIGMPGRSRWSDRGALPS